MSKGRRDLVRLALILLLLVAGVFLFISNNQTTQSEEIEVTTIDAPMVDWAMDVVGGLVAVEQMKIDFCDEIETLYPELYEEECQHVDVAQSIVDMFGAPQE